MSGDTEIEDLEVSEGGSENEYSDHEHEHEHEVVKEEDHADMAEQRFRPGDVDENGKAVATKPKAEPKDPLRPRRKKARRACFACQRAHLTCGMFASTRAYTFFRIGSLALPRYLLCKQILIIF